MGISVGHRPAMRPLGFGTLLALAACGGGAGGDGDGGSGDGGDPLTGEELAALCDEFCAHGVKCAWTDDGPGCEASCASDAGIFNGDLWRDWLECDAAAACAAPDPKGCLLQAMAAAQPRAIHDEYVDRCETARVDCGIAPEGVLPDCGVDEVLPFSDGYVASQVLPCFDRSCDAMIACIEETVRDAF